MISLSYINYKKLGDGSLRSTQLTTYNPDKKIAVFSEIIQFESKDSFKNSFFTLTIQEHNDYLQGKTQIVFKKILPFEENLEDENYRFVTDTQNYGEIHVYFSVKVSSEIKKTWKLVTPSKVENKEESSKAVGEFGQLEIFQLAPLFKKFLKSISNIVDAKEMITDFLKWKDPIKTMAISIMGSLIYLYARGLIVVCSLFIFAFGHIILAMLLKRKPKKQEMKFEIYKRNMVFIQVLYMIAYCD